MSATRPTRGYYGLSILNYIGTNTIVLAIPTRRSRKAKISIRFICDHTRAHACVCTCTYYTWTTHAWQAQVTFPFLYK